MKLLTFTQALNFLIDEVGIMLDITSMGYYYLGTDGDSKWLCWSPQESITTLDKVAVGIEIARCSRKNVSVLPAIMQILEGYKKIKITSIDLLQDITKAKEISMNILGRFENETIILTYLDISIALGTVLGQVFYPIVDVGWFLREGD